MESVKMKATGIRHGTTDSVFLRRTPVPVFILHPDPGLRPGCRGQTSTIVVEPHLGKIPIEGLCQRCGETLRATLDFQLKELRDGETGRVLFYNVCGMPVPVYIRCSCGGQTDTIQIEPHMDKPINVEGPCQKCGGTVSATVEFMDD